MTFDEIIKDLKNKIYHPVYFLSGEEPYYIDEISDYIESHVLEDHERDFNQTVLYGLDTNIDQILAEARRFPMMADYQVVIVKEAQNLKNLIPREMPDKPEDNQLLAYLLKPQKSTILVFCYKYKSVDKRKTTGKFLVKNTAFFQSEKIRDYHVPNWIIDHVSQKGYKIGPREAAILSEYLGADLGKIVNEVGKLTINLPPGSTIDRNIIEKYIGISKDYNVFEFQDALGKKNFLKAMKIANYFAANPKANPLPMLMANLYSYFSKLLIFHSLKEKNNEKLIASELKIHPFFVKDYQAAARHYSYPKLKEIFEGMRELDVKSKGVGNSGADNSDLMKEFLFRVMN